MFYDRWSPRRVVTSLAILLALAWFQSSISNHPFAGRKDVAISKTPPHPRNLTYLTRTLNLSPKLLYTSRIIASSHFIGTRPDLTTINETLFPPPLTLSKSELEDVEYPSLPPLTLAIPSAPEIDTSIFAFGIATSVPRLKTSLPQLAHWLSGTGSTLSVIAPPDFARSAMEAHAASLGMNISITASEAAFPLAYFSLVKRVYENRTPGTRWIVLMDDDTFIPSLPALAVHLSAKYNYEEDTIVAALTDDRLQIDAWGLIPFGGGGVFLSVPLAARLVSPSIWSKCEGGMGQGQGDGILSKCLNEYTDIRPKFDGGLNQMDITGRPEGLFESGRRMLTVHHWRTWFQVDVVGAGLVSGACGFECVFQRFVFPGENLVLSNGFSIVEFLGGVGTVDLHAVEKTWEGERERFLHRIGPLREPTPVERRVRYRLVEAEVVGGGVRQLYHRARVDGADGERGMDKVLELFWLSG